jgi:hypothetical protein
VRDRREIVEVTRSSLYPWLAAAPARAARTATYAVLAGRIRPIHDTDRRGRPSR